MAGARAVQRVLDKVDDDSLEVYVVWIPAIRTDSYEEALTSKSLISDKRAKHYWDGTRALGNGYAPVLSATIQFAWDVYIGYEPGTSWDGTPPEASEWLHQKSGEDPARRLDDEKLEAMVRRLVKK